MPESTGRKEVGKEKEEEDSVDPRVSLFFQPSEKITVVHCSIVCVDYVISPGIKQCHPKPPNVNRTYIDDERGRCTYIFVPFTAIDVFRTA